LKKISNLSRRWIFDNVLMCLKSEDRPGNGGPEGRRWDTRMKKGKKKKKKINK